MTVRVPARVTSCSVPVLLRTCSVVPAWTVALANVPPDRLTVLLSLKSPVMVRVPLERERGAAAAMLLTVSLVLRV